MKNWIEALCEQPAIRIVMEISYSRIEMYLNFKCHCGLIRRQRLNLKYKQSSETLSIVHLQLSAENRINDSLLEVRMLVIIYRILRWIRRSIDMNVSISAY